MAEFRAAGEIPPIIEAKGHLIAAAPELPDACELALAAFENNDCVDWAILKAAINKADGASKESFCCLASRDGSQEFRSGARRRFDTAHPG